MSLPEVVYAQASPISPGGTSLFAADTAIRADGVEAFSSGDSAVHDAVASLRSAGFEVLDQSATTINIAGPPQLYEEVFATTLTTEERPVIKPGARRDTATFIECPDTDIPGLIETAGTPLADVVEGVAIEKPVYWMGAQPFPPTEAYWHLRVPGDVSLGLRADPAHRLAVTGRGVKLVMADSGWFEHPYFVARGYRHSVVLGPAATEIAHDESGHGTGESANAFAAAPDIDFTMVKMSFTNSTGAFNRAVALQPDVISCSWGSDLEFGPLGAADRALAAAIAAAVARGIIVVFSAGNGHHGFPGQHPDVISAGGVYMDETAQLSASSYSSGFASRIYPGRNVPDASGLVGLAPGATYIALPVEPGDEIDVRRSGGSYPATDETAPDDGWGMFSGTSAAAPQLAGVCALMKEANPGLSPAEAREILKRTARDVTLGTNALGNTAKPGFDLATGAGLVDAAAAVREAARVAVGGPHDAQPEQPPTTPAGQV